MEDKSMSSSEENSFFNIEEKRRLLGIQLREARESKGLSQQNVEHLTRISLVFISAIEEGNLDILPGKVFGRGFIKSILKTLNVNPDPFIQSYNQCWEDENRSLKSDQKLKKTQDLLSQKSGKKWQNFPRIPFLNYFSYRVLVFWILIPVAVFSLIMFTILNYAKPIKEAETVSDNLNSPTSSQPTSEQTQLKATLPETTVKPPEAEVEKSVGNEANVPSNVTVKKELSKEDEKGKVIITVLEEVKIRQQISPDKYDIKSYPPGTYTFSFQDKIDFYIFDISAVEVTFNGQKLGKLGNKGEERKLSFHSNSIDVSDGTQAKKS